MRAHTLPDAITLNGDYIGLDLAGAADGNHGNGVFVSAHSSGDMIGLNSPGDSGVVANVISANTGSGLVLSRASDNTVVANRIGTNPAGSAAMANGGNGIWLTRDAKGMEAAGVQRGRAQRERRPARHLHRRPHRGQDERVLRQ
jgi:Periplasmic copper-binding protein (NosD)